MYIVVSLLFTAVEHSLEAPVTDASTCNIVVNVEVDCESTTTKACSEDKGGCMQYS